MIARVVFLVALVIATAVVVAVRRRGGPTTAPSGPTPVGWLTLALGLFAAVAFAIGATGSEGAAVYLTSIASATAAVVFGIGAL